MVVFWVVAQKSLLAVCQHFRGTYCLIFRTEVRRFRKWMVYVELGGGLG
jgi:hypothetical protein